MTLIAKNFFIIELLSQEFDRMEWVYNGSWVLEDQVMDSQVRAERAKWYGMNLYIIMFQTLKWRQGSHLACLSVFSIYCGQIMQIPWVEEALRG